MRKKKNERFYVFYDKDDFVKYCGTAKELVKMGYFQNTASVTQVASRIRNKKEKGHVVTMNLEGEIVNA